MNCSRPKFPLPEPYSEYFIENDYGPKNNEKLAVTYHKTHCHKRKTSQVSTLSCKSKNRNFSFYEKKNQSLTKHPSHNVILTDHKSQKTTGTSEKQSIHRKQFSLEKIRISNKNKNTLSSRKQKLKIDTQRKPKPKTTENLTSRYINHDTTDKGAFKHPYQSHKTSQSSFANKLDRTNQKTEANTHRHNNEKTIMSKLKIRQKNLELMVSRCSKVMTEYYERITLLKKQNDFLKIQNEELRKNNVEEMS